VSDSNQDYELEAVFFIGELACDFEFATTADLPPSPTLPLRSSEIALTVGDSDGISTFAGVAIG